MNKKMKAYKKDMWSCIRQNKKRFIAIMIITCLGTTMFSGLRAACVDLRHAADNFFDSQKLFDICVMSTLGLTKEDIAVLNSLDEVAQAEGVYSETVHILAEGKDFSAAFKTYLPNGLNQPYVLEGHLPSAVNEAAVTEKFAKESGLKIGDVFKISAASDNSEDTSFVQTQFEVCAIIIDALDVNNANGSVAFRSSATQEDTIYILPDAVDSDIYTTIYLTLTGAEALFCYSEEYEADVKAFTDYLETEIREQRTKARTQQIKSDAYEELEEKEQEVYEELEEAQAELLDGQTQLAEELEAARQELLDGQAQLEKELEAAAAELTQAETELNSAEDVLNEEQNAFNEQKKEAEWRVQETRKELLESRSQLEQKQAQINDSMQELSEGEAQLAEGKSRLEEQKSQLETALQNGSAAVLENQSLQSTLQAELAQLEGDANVTQEQIQQAQQALEQAQQAGEVLTAQQAALEQKKAEFDAAYAQLQATQEELLAGRQQLEQAQVQIDAAYAQLHAGESQLDASQKSMQEQFDEAEKQFAQARQEIADARTELSDGWKEYEAGKAEAEAELSDGWKEYENGKAEAEEKLADGWEEYEEGRAEAEKEFAQAKQEIAEIEMAEWYIQDRTSLSGYSNVKSDALSIEAIGTVFPILFFIVAILISLTTITRMVEEDRGLIGTYKALGFYDGEIRKKYVLYAVCASASGALLGTIGAFVVLPAIIFYIFSTMYLFPSYVFLFEPVFGISGPVVFIGGIVLATVIACRNELVQTPVSLMRPKTPRAGSRVFLERIGAVWNYMSFLNKVTVRNLFRYKKRLFMTVFGIMGCMALLLFGFAIKDSVTDLVPRQYEQTFYYDVMAVSADNDALLTYLEADEEIKQYLNVYISTVKLMNTQGKTESVQLVVVPEGEDLKEYICLRDLSASELSLEEKEVLLTQNASILLEIEQGQNAVIQTLNLDRAEVEISNIVQNYLGNYIYMTQDTYEQYGMEYEPNAAFIQLSEKCGDIAAYSKAFGERENIVTCISTQEMTEQFSSAFTLINMVVYIVIIMAACLAFVVLFTLATTNISERTRELATIKVLGFYDREVHAYVNKETMILTGIGIICGIPLGYAFAQTLTVILTLPSIYLAVSLHPISYVISGGLSLIFALLVNKITDRSLNGIDPVEALKSIE